MTAGFSSIPADSFHALISDTLVNYRSVVQKVKTEPHISWPTVIQPLEEAEEKFARVWNLLAHLNAVANTAAIRNTYEKLLPIVTEFHTDVMQDQGLYDIYMKMRLDPDFAKLNHAQQMIIENEVRDFILAGVHLKGKKRDEYKKLIQRLSELENEFSNNVLDATEAWSYHFDLTQEQKLAGIPEHALARAAELTKQQNKVGWIFTLDHPSYAAIVTYAKDREVRRIFYTAYATRAPDNSAKIVEILAIRQQLASLLEFDNYAQCSMVRKMAGNVTAVHKFLNQILTQAKPKAEQEFTMLCDYAKNQGHQGELAAWDVAYYSEMYKKEHYHISDEELRIYFPEPRVLNGLFKLARQIFEIEIVEESDFVKWHDSVRMFKVLDQNHELRGHFYIDLYTREGKRGGAWMADCVNRLKFSDDILQHPIAYLNCNFAPPIGDQPGLLTHDDVITLFHEFGHTLHHILTKVDYYSVSGMNGVAWDAVELPSQFMENWCWVWEVMQDISSLPRDLFDKLIATRNYQSAMAIMRQLEFALFDLRIHEQAGEDKNRSAQEILDDVRKKVSVLPSAEFNRFQNSFTHIFAGGYDAGYYSYLWAEVLSCDAFDIFKAAGLFNDQLGKKFLQTILEQGGSKPAMDLFVEFAEREPDVDALLRHHAIKT